LEQSEGYPFSDWSWFMQQASAACRTTPSMQAAYDKAAEEKEEPGK
jgi:hypothetical protein